MIRRSAIKSSPKPRKCKICRALLVNVRLGAVVCGSDCAAIHGRQQTEKESRKQAKIERMRDRTRREALKSWADHAKETQAAINSLARYRDKGDGCISCDKPANWPGQWHASHFRSVGAAPWLRFDLANIHKACSICNNYLSGNIGAYLPRLIEKIGQAEVDRLNGPAPQGLKRKSVQELIALRKWAVSELKIMKSRNISLD